MRPAARAAGLIGAAFVAVLALVLTGPAFAAGPAFPALTGRVVDDAHVLSPQTAAQLTQTLEALEAKTSRQLVVVTVPSLQGYPIEDFGYQLGRAWGVGQKGLNNGTLFLVAPSEHQVRIEVGYGLEGVITDALSSLILQTKVLPKFRAGDVQGGVVDGTNAIVEQLSLDASTAEKRAAEAATAQPAQHGRGGLPAIFVIFLVVAVLSSVLRGRGGGGLWFLPFMLMGGGRGGGWGDGGGGGGGGFSGGGGSFGGGGSSGSW